MMTRGGFFRALIGGGAVGAGVELVRGRSVRLPWSFDFPNNEFDPPALASCLPCISARLTCDGLELKSCYAANQGQGWARCYASDEEGKLLFDNNQDVRSIEYRGKLQLVLVEGGDPI
jgi:hypothetical protein